MNRVCIFIDGSNLYHALKRNQRPTRVDYYELSKLLVGDRQLVRTYYYNAGFSPEHSPVESKVQQLFFDNLYRTPYLELRLGHLIPTREGGRIEKGVDVHMAVDMVYYASLNFYDTAIVVTEDQDFAPAILAVKEMGKNVETAIFADGAAKEMVKAADKTMYLNTLLVEGCSVFLFCPEGSVLPSPSV